MLVGYHRVFYRVGQEFTPYEKETRWWSAEQSGETVSVPSNRLVQIYYLPATANPRVDLPKIRIDDFSQTVKVPSGEDGVPDQETTEDSAVMLSAITYSGRLVMQMAGRVAGATASCLFDSGSETNVISRAFAERQGVVIQPDEGSVELGDSHVATQVGTAKVFVQFGAFHKSVPCLVLEKLLGDVDFIIGDGFMRAQQCTLDYGKCRVTFQKGRRRITVNQTALKRDKLSSKVPEKEPKLLTAIQVKRRAKRGQYAMLAVVTEFEKGKDDKAVKPGESDDKTWVNDMQEEFADIFVDPLPPGLPPEREYGHTIPTEPGHVPPFRPMYRLSPLEVRETKEQLARFIEQGIIEPSKSPYGAPILFVPKPNGRGLRLCVDFRALNLVTIKNRYPIPRIDDLLDSISGAKFFTSIDLTSGYHQIRITEEDVPKTAFRTPFGHFQFKVLIEGLTNAPATFQNVMNNTFREYIGDFVNVYLDDILVYSKTEAEHRKHLRLVFEKLREEKFYACLQKCEFAKPEIKFLGHIVGADGIKVNPAKIAAVNDWQPPKTVHQVRSFLGLANYFRKFIQGYAKLAAPLTDLTKAVNPFIWTPECQESFDGIKWALTNAPVLVSPDESKKYEVVCDASGIGLGAVLLQNERPIAYESRKLSGAESRYTTGEQELLAVVHALQTWRCYLEGVHFLLITDHKPNTFFQTQPILSRRQARWSELLQRFDYQWEYRAGRTNVADPLSRNPVGPALATILRNCRGESPPMIGQSQSGRSSPTMPVRNVAQRTVDLHSDLVDSIVSLCAFDPWLKTGSNQLTKNWQGLWFRGSQIYVPDSSLLKKQIFEELHDSKVAGHYGIHKTRRLVERLFWWPHLREEVERYVKHCPVCQFDKSSNLKPAGLLQPLPIPQSPWDSVSFDFITALPRTERGNEAIVVFVDRLTKFAYIYPCQDTITAEGFAELWYEVVYRNEGVSREFISDRDPRFTSKFWEEACKLLGTKLARSTAFHPQTDGQTERVNRILETYLRHYVSTSHSDWDILLAGAQFAYNNAWQESVGNSPFYLNRGRHARIPLGHGLVSVPAAGNFVDRIQESISRAKTLLIAAQQRQKSFADRGRRELEFEVGASVLLSTKYLQLKNPGARKLLPKWIGPFKILKRVGQVAYRLDLPVSLKIHPVFHVSLVQPYRSDGRVQPPPPPIELEDGLEYEVERILNHRDRKVRTKGNRTVIRTDYLVSWKGYGPEHNSFEPEKNLKNAQDAIQEYWDVTAKRSAGEKRRHRRAGVASIRKAQIASPLSVSETSKEIRKRKRKPRPLKRVAKSIPSPSFQMRLRERRSSSSSA